MATKEEREDRKKRIDKTKDRDNLIADNGLDGKVIDVYDILARSNSPVIVNLRKLNQYGITDVMIANLYENLTSSVETRDSAMDTLKNVYINLVRYINKLPNGIVLDPKTGEKDPIKSYEQAVMAGIENDQFYKKNQEIGNKVIKAMIKDGILTQNENNENIADKFYGIIDRRVIKDINNKNNDIDKKIFEKIKQLYIKDGLLKELKFIGNVVNSYKDNSADISTIPLEERMESAKALFCIMYNQEMGFSEEEKKEAYDRIYELFPNEDYDKKDDNGLLKFLVSKYENIDIESLSDAESISILFSNIEKWSNEAIKYHEEEANKEVNIANEILLLEAKLQYTDKNSPDYIILMSRMNKIHEENPQYMEKFNSLRNENGSVTIGAQKMVNEYVGTMRDITLNAIIDTTDISKLSDEERDKHTTYLLVAATTETNNELAKKSLSILKQMYPDIAAGIEKNNGDKSNLIEKITTRLLGKNIEYEEEIDLMRETINKILVENQFEKFISGEKDNKKISDEEVDRFYTKESVELLTGIDLTKSTLQNKFNKDSKMEFSESDEKTYMELYKKSSIGSWISTKDEVFFHRYMAILLLEDKLSEEEIANGQTKYKICQNMLAKMQRENPELAKKISEYTPEQLQELKEQERRFEKDKLNSKVLDFYQKNVLTLNPDYYHLDKQDRFEYLRITILSRELAKSADTPEESQMLLKLSNRALEIMNTEENKFIEFDENGNGIVNEDVLLSEYKNYTTVNRLRENNLDEIGKNLYDKYQRVYFVGKMTEYSKLKDSDFGALKSNSDDEKLSEIISFKEKKNKERLDDLINQKEAEETNESEKKESGKQSPLKTEEISTDNRDFQDLTEEKSLVPQDNSIFGRFKKAINELKNNARDAFKKFKDLFAGKNPEEKNEEKNEINGQNPKKVQESAFDKYRVEGISGKIQEQSQSQTVTGEKQGQKNQEGKTEEYEDITM